MLLDKNPIMEYFIYLAASTQTKDSRGYRIDNRLGFYASGESLAVGVLGG
jgi:hypothetical protein